MNGRVLVIGAGGVATVAIVKMAMNSDIFKEIKIASRTKAKCDNTQGALSLTLIPSKVTAGFCVC